MSERPKVTSSIVIGVVLIALGVLFLVGQFLRVEFWSVLWPFFIILFGAAFFVGMFASGRRAGGLAIPGSMFVILGLILLAENLFGNWVSMAYAWALFAPMGVGVGIVIQSWYSQKPELKRPGYILIATGLILFVCFGAFFELVLSIGAFARTASVVWPVILIALGVFMIVGRLFNWSRVLDALPPRDSSQMRTPAPEPGKGVIMTTPSLPGEPRPTPLRRRRSVSLFWPIALIGVGVAALLSNAGLLVNDPLMLLAQYWPVLLITAGIEMIFQRTGWLGTLVSALAGLVVAGGAIFILMTPGMVTPVSGLVIFSANNPLRAERVARPLEGARAAKVDFDLRSGAGSLQASKDSPNLIEAEASLRGELVNDLQRSGDTAMVRLGTRGQPFPLFFFEWAMGERWDIRINPAITLDLNLNIRSGTLASDLSGLTLREVILNQDSGQSSLVLPESGQYRLNLQVDSGSAEIKLPRGLPTRVRYHVNSGAVNTSLNRASGNNRDGTYETPGFSQSGSYVLIDIQLNSGSVTVR